MGIYLPKDSGAGPIIRGSNKILPYKVVGSLRAQQPYQVYDEIIGMVILQAFSEMFARDY